MAGKCVNCRHKLQHPHHAGIGVCANADSLHHKKCVGDSLKCKHHEVNTISQIKRHNTFEDLIKAGMNRRMKVV
jgi:hypothetical protein